MGKNINFLKFELFIYKFEDNLYIFLIVCAICCVNIYNLFDLKTKHNLRLRKDILKYFTIKNI